tara:strand:+ start:7515 stop:9167 length:1653 start_codon:yes stop_codon:yes gene_type:complete
MIKIIVTAFTNTKSNFLINIIHGLIYNDEPIYTDIEKWIAHKLIIKTHDTNIEKLNITYGNSYNLYFIGCENVRPYLKKYYSMENVIIFKTPSLIISETNDLQNIVEYVYNTLQPFLPSELFNIDKTTMLNKAIQRILNMTAAYHMIENKYSNETNTFYNIHGGKQINQHNILFFIYENTAMFEYINNILFSIFFKEFHVDITPSNLSSSCICFIYKKDIDSWKNMNEKNKITFISLENKNTSDSSEIILYKSSSDIAHILSVQIRKINNSYKPLLAYSKFKNTILKEKFNLLVISMYESGGQEMIHYFEKNGYNCKSISFEKIILHYPTSIHNSDIPIVYCYRNIKNAYLSTIKKGRYQNAISNICNNKKQISSSKILLQAMIKQFQNMTFFDNIHFIKTDDLNDDRYNKLCTFLKKDLLPFPDLHWNKTNISSNNIFSNFLNEIKNIELYPNVIPNIKINTDENIVINNIENDLTPKAIHSSVKKLKKYNTETPPPVYNPKLMLFTSLKEQTRKPRNKKHNHVINNKTTLPHHKKKLYVHRKNFFLPF